MKVLNHMFLGAAFAVAAMSIHAETKTYTLGTSNCSRFIVDCYAVPVTNGTTKTTAWNEAHRQGALGCMHRFEHDVHGKLGLIFTQREEIQGDAHPASEGRIQLPGQIIGLRILAKRRGKILLRRSELLPTAG
jgi:hypothetical protein